MQLRFEVTVHDRRRAQNLYDEHKHGAFVRRRIKRNVEGQRPKPSRSLFWKAMMSALLTTQQRSGPTSPVSRLIQGRPFRLSFDRCREATNVSRFVQREIASVGGIRRGATIGEQAQCNFELLTTGGWPELRRTLEALDQGPTTMIDERAAARLLAARLAGLGPKQSRNTLQMLGLTRFETPIDSRITAWLNDFGFPVAVSAGALSDPGIYELVEDGFQALCAAIDVYPTVMDAVIFASYDGDGWEAVHERYR